MKKNKLVLGIDLGTTYSCMCYYNLDKEDFEIIPNEEGKRITPSVVAYKKDEILCGDSAKSQMALFPKTVLSFTKKGIGRSYSEAVKIFLETGLPFKIVDLKNQRFGFETEKGIISPEEVASQVLIKLVRDAKKYCNVHENTQVQAVITVPAYFNDSQRDATIQAAKIAGIEVLRIINEPTAAAIAYGLDKDESSNIAVYDLGGGTFDVSILELSQGVFEVKATDGDTNLGGCNFDSEIVKWMLEQAKSKYNADLSKDPQAMQRLVMAAEEAKKSLSSSKVAQINLPFIAPGVNLLLELTVEKFNALTRKYVDRTLQILDKTIKESKIEKSKINAIILVGGMTRVPIIQSEIEKIFGKERVKFINPDECVGLGAGILAHKLTGGASGKEKSDILLIDVTPLSLGIETQGGVMTVLIAKNHTIPAKQTQVFSTAADNQTTVTIHVCQGERSMASDNKSLGRFDLSGIPPAPRGIPQIEVTFEIDVNGILHVSAKDQSTGKEAQIKITGSGSISKEELEKMKQQAEQFKEEDEKRKKRIEAINSAEHLIFSTNKILDENKEKIDESIKNNINEASNKLKQIIENQNSTYEEIVSETENFNKSISSLYEHIQKSSNPGSNNSSSNESGNEG